MKMLSLLRKQFLRNKFSVLKSSRAEVFTAVIKWLIYAFIGCLLCYGLYIFADSYSKVYLEGTGKRERLFEIQTSVFAVIFLTELHAGIKYFNVRLFRDKDIEKMRTLPISRFEYIVSELIILYIRQFIRLAILIIPQAIVLLIIFKIGYIRFIGGTILSLITMPLITVFISSFFAIPVHILKHYIGKKYLISLAISLLVVGIIFIYYGKILNGFKSLLVNGEIQHFFLDQEKVRKIFTVSRKLIPVSLLSSITFGSIIKLDFLYVFLTLLISGGLSILSTFFLYEVASNLCIERKSKTNADFKVHGKKNLFGSLLKKEFLTVIRDPVYTRSYLGIVILLPLFVYMLTSVLNDTISSLLFLDVKLAITVSCLILFIALINSFAASNFSRDYDMMQFMRTTPCRYREQMLAKITFCLISTSISILLTSIVLASTKVINIYQALFVFLIGQLANFTQIILATKMDFDKPEEGSSNNLTKTEVKVTMFWGFIALIIGIVPIIFNTALLVKKKPVKEMYTYLFIFALISLVVVIVITYFFVSIRKTEEVQEKNYIKMSRVKNEE